MKASLVFRSIFLGALLVLAGCSKSAQQEQPLPVVPDDGGSTHVVKLDAEVVGDGAGDATRKADGNRDSGAAAAMDGAVAAGPPPSITLTVDPASLVPPADGGVPNPPIIPASYGPKPVVTVTVVSNSGDMRADDVSSVTGSLNVPVTGTPAATVTLAKSETDSVPESNTTRFVFSDVPIDLSKVPTGSYNLVFTATTVGGTSASTQIAVWVDSGPIIVVVSPTEGGYYKGSAPVEVDTTQTNFPVTLITMAVGQGDAVPLTQTSTGVYKGTIDFNSYVPPLVGDELVTFRAYDENGVETVVARDFVSDNTGPSISATVPANGAMIGNVITISATVVDPAGVDTSSVVAVVANGDQTFQITLAPSTTVGSNVFSNLFDTTKLPSYALFPTISFRARDVLGNESTVSYELSLDNTPPIIDLDPPYVRRVNSNGNCSWAFDPVGPDAVDDGDMVTQLFDVRVQAEDRGNKPLTGTTDFTPIGGVDQSNVQLLILSNTSRPLVVDTSNPPDGLCDAINPELVPTTNPQTDVDAQLITMVPMAPLEGADFSRDPSVACSTADTTVVPPDPDSFCATTENDSKAQFAVGDSTHQPHCYTMTEVLNYSANGLPSIYTIGPIVADGLQCAGHQFDSSNNLKDGWACLAVAAQDILGNKQVSRPIRICVVATPGSTACSDFKSVTGVVLSSNSVEIDTAVPLVGPGGAALQANDEVIVSGLVGVSGVNGRWPVTPLDSSGLRFSLQGAQGVMGGASLLVAHAYVVPVASMPDCTGTLIQGGTDGGLPVVDYTQPCKPFSSFVAGAWRPYGQ